MMRPGWLARGEALDKGLGEEEGALEVDVEDGVVVGFGDLEKSAPFSTPALLTRMSQRPSCVLGLLDEVLVSASLETSACDDDGFAAGCFSIRLRVSSAPSAWPT